MNYCTHTQWAELRRNMECNCRASAEHRRHVRLDTLTISAYGATDFEKNRVSFTGPTAVVMFVYKETVEF